MTVFTCLLSGGFVEWLRPWWAFDPQGLEKVGFVGVFLILMLLVGLLVRRIAGWMAHERSHWINQSAGMALGAVRGAWWAGLIVLLMLSFQHPYLTQSITERSLVAPHLVHASRTTLRWITDQVPGLTTQAAKPLLLR